MRWSLLVALLAFLLPQEIPLEFYPLTDPAPGTLYLEFKGRFEAPGAYYSSEDFAGNGWWKPKTVVCTADALLAPDGAKTADILQAGAGTYAILTAQDIPKSSVEDFSFSIFVRRQNHRYLGLILGEARRTLWPFFDFDTGQCTVPPDMPSHKLRAEPVGAGWWRLILAGPVPVAATGSSRLVGVVLVNEKGKSGAKLAGTEQVAVWGAQTETGLSASPYLPSGLVAPDHRGARFIFQPDFGWGYRVTEQLAIPISHSASSFTYTLPLLDAPLQGLRLTPVDRPGRLIISGLRLIDRSGREIHRFPSEAFLPSYGTRLEHSGTAWTLQAEPGVAEPYATILLPHPFVPAGMTARNLQRCLASWAYLTGMLTLLLVTVAWLFLPRGRWDRRSAVVLVIFLGLLAGLFSSVAQRGLLKNTMAAARLETSAR